MLYAFISTECYDFAPNLTTDPPSSIKFEPVSATMKKASDWTDKQTGKNILAVETVEITFKPESLGNRKPKIGFATL